jgi:hypothetical protein
MMNQPAEEEASMRDVSIVGVDLAKQAFQLHAAAGDGSVVFRRKLSRSPPENPPSSYLARSKVHPACAWLRI